jgi:hypothetical protein
MGNPGDSNPDGKLGSFEEESKLLSFKEFPIVI